MKTRILMLLAVLMLTAVGAKADDVLVAEVSGTTMTLKCVDYYNQPEGSYYFNASDSWSTAFRATITKAVIDESCKNYKKTSLGNLFKDCAALETIEGLENLNTSKVTNMENIFLNCQKLTNLDLRAWDTSNVTRMTNMFYKCNQLSSLNVSTWNTANVKTMASMFGQCTSLTSLDLTGWNTAKVEDMGSLFLGCTQLVSIFVSDEWSTASIAYTNSSTFSDCTSIVGEDGTKYSSREHGSSCAHYGAGGYLRNNLLYADADNTAHLMAWNGKTFGAVKLVGVTLKTDEWNVICLPFSLDAEHIAADFPDGTIIKTFSAYTNTKGNGYIDFANATSIKKGVPYIINIAGNEYMTDPVFHDVIIQPANVKTTKGDVSFIGTYNPKTFVARNNDILHLESGNLWLFVEEDVTLPAFSGYFDLSGDASLTEDSGVSVYYGYVPNGIEGVSAIDTTDGAWFTITGVQLEGEPTAPGVYVKDGRKVMVK